MKYGDRVFSVMLTAEHARRVKSIRKAAQAKLRERERHGHVTKAEVLRYLLSLGLESLGEKEIPDIKALDPVTKNATPPGPKRPPEPPPDPPPDIDLRHLFD